MKVWDGFFIIMAHVLSLGRHVELKRLAAGIMYYELMGSRAGALKEQIAVQAPLHENIYQLALLASKLQSNPNFVYNTLKRVEQQTVTFEQLGEIPWAQLRRRLNKCGGRRRRRR
jgi:hypothetical protein